MSIRSWVPSSSLVVAMAITLSSPGFLAAQAASAQGVPASATKTATPTKAADKKPWKLSYTPDGQPDLQGYWNSATFTPMERPAIYKGREFLTPEETQEVFKSGVQHTYEFTFANSAETPVYDATVYALGAWQNGVQPNPRSSLIVDPPDGKFPPLTAEAAKARGGRARAGAEAVDEDRADAPTKADDPADLGIGTRCLSFSGPPLLPHGYNNTTHIVQGPGYVVLEFEWGSEPRIIPLVDSPRLSSNVHRWNGDSRGHWEGNTLVIETTNFRPDATFQGSNAKTLKITEYLTRTAENTIEYKFTVNDPSTWTKPWTAIEPISQVDGPMFEYACSEGNNGLVNILEGARMAEKEAKEKAAGSPISQK